MSDNTMDTNPALIEIYMEALKQRESSGDYQVLHAVSTIKDSVTGKPVKVQGLGAYGVLDINWYGTETQQSWAEQAGLKGHDWHDPDAQDAVVKHKLEEYFNRFGSWDLVSVAWFSGPNDAKKLKDTGTMDFNKSDNQGMNVQGYIDSMNDLIAKELMQIEVPMEDFRMNDIYAGPPDPVPQPQQSSTLFTSTGEATGDNYRYAANIIDQLTKARSNGERPNINLNVTEKNPNSPREMGLDRE